MSAVKKYHEQITTTGKFGTIDKGDIAYKRKVPLKPTDWVSPAQRLELINDRTTNHPIHLTSSLQEMLNPACSLFH